MEGISSTCFHFCCVISSAVGGTGKEQNIWRPPHSTCLSLIFVNIDIMNNREDGVQSDLRAAPHCHSTDEQQDVGERYEKGKIDFILFTLFVFLVMQNTESVS